MEKSGMALNLESAPLSEGAVTSQYLGICREGYIFKSEYNCFTILCSFLLSSKVNRYMCALSFAFPSHLCHYRVLSRRFPLAIQSGLISYLFIQSSVYIPVPLLSRLFPASVSTPGKLHFVKHWSFLCKTERSRSRGTC